MSITTALGFLFGMGLFIGSIAMSTDNFISFWSPSSLILVFGGTLAVAFMSYQGRYVVKALRDIGRIFTHAKVNRKILFQQSQQVGQWGQIVAKNGILALEAHLKKDSGGDPFIATGIRMVVDNQGPDTTRELLTNMTESSFARATVQADILANMSATSPAFGMIGTLVGLIIMLQNMGGDTSALGQGLAVALLTTLYGVLFAKLVFQPAADKTRQRESIIRFRNLLMVEGFVMLSEGRTPRFIQDRINSFLDPNALKDYLEKNGGAKK
jgi:chemotaxis protein MotA